MKTGFFKLTPKNKDDVHKHFASLSADDKYLRFGTHVSNDYLNNVLGRLNTNDMTGYYSDGEILALYQLSRSGEKSYEFAVSVHETLRGRGMGSTLMNMAIEAGQDLGADSILVLHMRENEAMNKICANKPKIRKVNGNEVECEIKLNEIDDLRMLPDHLVSDEQ